MALRCSPSMSYRTSPPVTRSASRNGLRQPFETSTPVSRRSLQPDPVYEREIEYADDSIIANNESHFNYGEHFTTGEMTSMKKEIWWDWIKYRIRMAKRRFTPSLKNLRDTFIFVVLAAMLCTYAHSSYKAGISDPEAVWNTDVAVAERQKFHQSISNLKSEIEILEKRFSSKVDHVENELDSANGWKDSVGDELKDIKTAQALLRDELNKLKLELEEEKEKSEKVILSEPAPVAPNSSLTADIQRNTSHLAPVRRSLPGVNVANSLIGASIDETCSSRTASAKDGLFYDVMSYMVSFHEGYVLLDRDALSPGQAWCTYDSRPTLTVKLARDIQPTAVSYQHVRWNGIVPNHAPKLYDLVACLSSCCAEWEPLVTNCEYKALEDQQEQICNITSNFHTMPVRSVQFRFRENHGNMKKTCAYLVRVYGDLVEPPKETTTKLENGSHHLESALLNGAYSQS